MFQKLLVAIDNTERSDVALSFATAIAQQCSAAVHVLHVNEFVVGTRGMTLFTDEKAIQRVTQAIGQLRSEGIRTSGSVRRALYRHVAPCIASMATEISADAIVLGTGRNRRFGRLFAPQVRERTIRLTTLPVIAAPAPLVRAFNGQLDDVDFLQVPLDREWTLSA
jgi:nucleotide-binding universal stress UspA family protein